MKKAFKHILDLPPIDDSPLEDPPLEDPSFELALEFSMVEDSPLVLLPTSKPMLEWSGRSTAGEGGFIFDFFRISDDSRCRLRGISSSSRLIRFKIVTHVSKKLYSWKSCE